MKRRTFVAVAGSLATAGLAGCGEAGPGADNETSPGDADGLGDDDGLGDGTDDDGIGGDGIGDDTPTDGLGTETPTADAGAGDAPTDDVGGDQETPGDRETDTPAVGEDTATPEGVGTPTDGADDPNIDDVEGQVGRTPENLIVVEHRLVETSDGAAVLGTARNMGSTPFQAVTADVTLDDGDTYVDDDSVNSSGEFNELGPGETWRFVVEFDGDSVSEATGYTITLEGELADEES